MFVLGCDVRMVLDFVSQASHGKRIGQNSRLSAGLTWYVRTLGRRERARNGCALIENGYGGMSASALEILHLAWANAMRDLDSTVTNW